MPSSLEWKRLYPSSIKNESSNEQRPSSAETEGTIDDVTESGTNCTARSGHSLSNIPGGSFILFGGMDGRMSNQSIALPNNDVYEISFSEDDYDVQKIQLSSEVELPAGRTLHSATVINDEEIFIFGGIFSSSPFRALNDGWIYNFKKKIWSRVQFKESNVDREAIALKRLSGLIENVIPIPTNKKQSDILNRLKKGGATGPSFEDVVDAARNSIKGPPSRKGSVDSSKSFMSKGSRVGGSQTGASASLVAQQQFAGSIRQSIIESAGPKSFKGILQKKMSMAGQSIKSSSARMSRKLSRMASSANSAENLFHDSLVASVMSGNQASPTTALGSSANSSFPGTCDDPNDPFNFPQPANVPEPRSNHTCTATDTGGMLVLFGGYGGSGYSRKTFNDVYLLNTDNFRWTELICQGNAPAPRCGHTAFCKDGMLYIFGGWNSETQFNDLYVLDIENKDWSDVDLSFGVPRWNMTSVLIEAMPNWKLFVFGGAIYGTDTAQRGGNGFDNGLICLDLNENSGYSWSDIDVGDFKNPPDSSIISSPNPLGREHSTCVYDGESSSLFIFGGWSDCWLGDVWKVPVSSIVGPPYAISAISRNKASVRGGVPLRIFGVGFKSTSSTAVTVRFIGAKNTIVEVPSSNCQIISDEEIVFITPDVSATIGPLKSHNTQLSLAIGNKDFTITKLSFSFYLETDAEKSVCFGPALLPEQNINEDLQLIISSKNEKGVHQICGGDRFQFDVYIETEIESKQTTKDDDDVEKNVKTKSWKRVNDHIEFSFEQTASPESTDIVQSEVEIPRVDVESMATISYRDNDSGRYYITMSNFASLSHLSCDPSAPKIRLEISLKQFSPVQIEQIGNMSQLEFKAIKCAGSPIIITLLTKGKPKTTTSGKSTSVSTNNDLTGPAMASFIANTMKDFETKFRKMDQTLNLSVQPSEPIAEAAIPKSEEENNSVINVNDYAISSGVSNLIKVQNEIDFLFTNEGNDEYLLNQIHETISHFERNGMPNDKAVKNLKKIRETLQSTIAHCKAKQREISPISTTQSDVFKTKIANFTTSVKEFQTSFKKMPLFFYNDGDMSKALSSVNYCQTTLSQFDQVFKSLTFAADSFKYSGNVLGDATTSISTISESLKHISALWDFEDYRKGVTNKLLKITWGEVDPDGVEDEIKALLKKSKELKVDKKCNALIGVNDVIKKWLGFVPLIAELRDPAMRDRHWSALLELCLGKEGTDEDSSIKISDDMCLEKLWEIGVHNNVEGVEEITDQAKQEAKMETMLEKLKTTWADIDFDFTPHKGNENVQTMKVSDDNFEMLEEHQVAVQNMFASRYLSTFETEVNFWHKTLANISEVSVLLSEVERAWAFLENLFIHSEEVKKELPEESERFVGIDVEVRKILADGFKVRNAMEFCNKEGLFNQLEKTQSELSVCEKALNDFMDGKRRAFPRFYFVSTMDLLDILSNGNTPAKVMPHLSKIFQAVSTYHLEGGNDGNRPYAVSMDASVGVEHVKFYQKTQLVGKVEIYLSTCIEISQSSIKHYLSKAIDDCFSSGDSGRPAWVRDQVDVAQCALLVNNLSWVKMVEEAFDSMNKGDSQAMVHSKDRMSNLLLDLIKLTQTDLDKPTRQRVMCMITLDAHNRDIQEKLVVENVNTSDAFQWQAQLKAYWDKELNDCKQCIADATFIYGYEYLGNGPRLVVTPLTDRIYVTATQALHLCMGCAPAGPAGTGKTETTKDLSAALAKACYVFNASPEMDYQTMGNIFKGLASSGTWGCFDEFNRLVPEVLSVCTVQFKAVCDAIKGGAERFILQGDEITLDPGCGAFITMNPGYLGRSELPEGLKALFRPITVMVPDFALIMENMFMAEGFLEAKILAKKFSTLYFLCGDLLSKAPQYDWGMRAIKSVLVVAGSYKRAEPDLPEQAVLMRSLRDTNVAKIFGDDLRIFTGLLADLFPGIDVPRARDLKFEETIESVMTEEFKFTPDEHITLKVTQLAELLSIRHCVFIMGSPGAFKSALWKILAKSKDKIGEKTTVVDLNPKAISTNELYGYVNITTREWKDGILSKTMRSLGQINDTQPKWMILDGDLDANWVESMNSVMDDSKLLTLPSNERIPLKPHMRMLFEIRDLSCATPATVTRAGVVYVTDENQWKCYKTSWVNKQSIPKPAAEQLTKLFDKYVDQTIKYVHTQCKSTVPVVTISIVECLCRMLESIVTKTQDSSRGKAKSDSSDNPMDSLEVWFVFCLIWAVGGVLAEVDGVDYRKQFSGWWKNEMKTVKFPSKGTVFDYYVTGGKLEEWSNIVPVLNYNSMETPMNEITVPTSETVATSYFMKALIEIHAPVMLIGLSGCGKTQIVNGLLKSLDPSAFSSYTMNMNYYTDSQLLQNMMEMPLEKKAGRLYAPPGKLRLIYYIDDLNMPQLDTYNTQSAIALLRQCQDYGHWYDRHKITLKDIGNTQYVACMNPTAGSFIINPRLQRHFWSCSIPFPDQSALSTIYATFMKGHFENPQIKFKSPVVEIVTSIIKSTLTLHSTVASTFRKTASNFHYEFNIRHLTGVFGGLLQAKPAEFTDPEKLCLLWLHECERVYCDRLVSPADVKKYKALSGELAKKHYSKFNFSKYFSEKTPETLTFATFSKGFQDEKCYDKLPSVTRLTELVTDALREYNEMNANMDLVLFEDAVSHVTKITRIIANSAGHALLVGVGGSGRQSLSRLSAFISGYQIKTIVISSTYGINDFKTDLQWMYNKAGVKDEGVCFLFTDGQITNEKFLVFVNDLLASGDIADLYANEDKDVIRNNVRSGCKAAGITDTPENLWSFFISRIRKNLHMCICFSPVGDAMRGRARKFPALVNCTVIDWFQPWPKEALYSVAQKFLSQIEELGDGELRNSIVEYMPFSFECVGQASQRFIEYERRFAYTTPKSFLELIRLYTNKLTQAIRDLLDKRERLSSGLEKLRETQTSVAALEEDLKEKSVVVEEKAAAADVFAEQVGREKAVVNAEAEKANIEAAKCSEIQKDVSIQAESCEADLAKAIPLVQKAEAALDVLNKKDFQELKSFSKPPDGVDKVCEAVMHLQATIDPIIEVDKKGKVKDTSWKGAQKMMGNPEKFLENLKEFKKFIDDSKVPKQNFDFVRPLISDPVFSVEIMTKKSQAAAGLCEWVLNIVLYYDVVVTVEPKRNALRNAQDTLNEANAKLAEVQALVAELEAKLAKLVAEFDAANAEKEKVMAEAARCKNKLDMAQRLIGALGANGVIWEQTVAQIAEEIEYVPGNVLIACSFVSYVGVFTRTYREECINEFVKFLKSKNVPLSKNPDPLVVLTNEAEMAMWNSQGLPSDRVSVENGAILTNSERFCIIIDPQLQGVVWIKNKVGAALTSTRMGHNKMLQCFERALDGGSSVLIENMDESIDAVLAPVIGRNVIKRGRNNVVKIGDKEINWHKDFCLYMHTKLSNPHYPPEIQAECTVINFTVTESGLEDQLLFLVVKLERPDLARQKSDLIQQQNQFKVKLSELEALLLEKLANSTGDILDDTDLILSLEDAKHTSDEVKAKVVVAQETEAMINEISENYRPCAARGALLFFLLMDLCKVHSFYRFSLDAFVVVCTTATNSVRLPRKKRLKSANKNNSRPGSANSGTNSASGSPGVPTEESPPPPVEEDKPASEAGGSNHEASPGAEDDALVDEPIAESGELPEEEENKEPTTDTGDDIEEEKEEHSDEEEEKEEGQEEDAVVVEEPVKEEEVEETGPTDEEEGDEDAWEETDELEQELVGEDLKKRVLLLLDKITYYVFNYTRRGLFGKHKLMVATMLTVRILEKAHKINREEVDALVKAAPDANAPPMPESAKSWLTENQWKQMKNLENGLSVFKSSSGTGTITQNLDQDCLGWKRWFNEERAESTDLPRNYRDLSAFHQLIIIRILRPDRLPAALSNFVSDYLGIEFIEQPPFSMADTYAESSALTPLFFVLFPGVDPTPAVEAQAKVEGVSSAAGTFINISMGQGQEQIAINALNNCAKEGGWLMLQNIHLMQSWLRSFERALETIEDGIHPNFRLFLTSEPPNVLLPLQDLIPEAILQKCIKVADEAPQDIKSNLRRAWNHFDQNTLDSCKKGKEFKSCLFALCFFHSIVVGRKRFGPQGWSRAYPFNDGDLTICANVLHNYLEAYDSVPWPDLRYIFGEIMYGGHITDKWDRRTNNSYLDVLITPELLNGMNLAPGFKSPDSSKMDYTSFVKYIEDRLPSEVPQMFGLHPNAEIGFLTNFGTSIFSMILDIQGGGGGDASGGGGTDPFAVVSGLITTYLTNLPEPLAMDEIRAKCTDFTPYVIVSLQEGERMNRLLNEIRRSLIELEMGIAGALNITDQMEALANSLELNRVPANWEKLAYWSLKNLSSWYDDLLLRVAQLVEWTNKLSLLKSLWISGLFNPMSFLTAVMQVTARENELPLDYMCIRCLFTNYKEVSDISKDPQNGVYVHGLFMEGAGWEDGKKEEEGYITESKLKELHPAMPVLNVYAVHMDDFTWESMYHCPVFLTSIRGPTFVFQANVRMDPDDDETRWILAGAALLMSDD